MFSDKSEFFLKVLSSLVVTVNISTCQVCASGDEKLLDVSDWERVYHVYIEKKKCEPEKLGNDNEKYGFTGKLTPEEKKEIKSVIKTRGIKPVRDPKRVVEVTYEKGLMRYKLPQKN